MNPIYDEYITFLRNASGQSLPELKEGFFWLNNQVIKGFDDSGKIHKFFRVRISDNLEKVEVVKLKKYSDVNKVRLISWTELIDLQKEHLQQLETDSLKLIQDMMEKYNMHTPIIPVSMGKDSMLTCHLVRSLYPNTKAIFNNTSLDCAETYRMVKDILNCEIMNPDKGFYQYVKSNHITPTRFVRFCCRIFKVGTMVSQLNHKHPYLLWMGMRNEESNTRNGYGDEIINPEWGKTCWQGILPIRKWTEMDVWLYTIWKNIDINPKYKKGYSRVGCNIACPFYTKSTWILDKYWYPYEYQRWRDILTEDFIQSKKWIIMNCTITEYITQAWNGGTFRDNPTDEVIKEFAEYNHFDIDVASKYFNKYCDMCGKRIKDKEVLAMNMKFCGRSTSKFLCKKCFMQKYELDDNRWDSYVQSFKRSGCDLF